jgi:amidase
VHKPRVRTAASLAAKLIILASLTLNPIAGKAKEQPFNVVETTIDQVHAAYKSGQLTSRQLVQLYLDRIMAYDQHGPTINSIITLNPKALQEAERLDAQFKATGFVGPLHGIPILVKDELDAVGMPTTLGSIVFKDFRPTKDAFVIERLKKAGAIILGKTSLGEFASGDAFGSMFGVTRNPYDLERTAGGSSGGSGAALAANLATVAIGEETSGSLRRPGGWNDLVALRPTGGLVSRTGMYDGWPSPNATPGPMARSVADLAKTLDVMVGYDPEDPESALGVGHVPDSYTNALVNDGLKGARVGILRESIGHDSEPASEDFKKVDAVFEENVAELKAAGAVVVDSIVIPRLKDLLARRAGNPINSDEALKIWMGRNPNSPYKTREDIQKSPDIDKIIPPPLAAQWKAPRGRVDLSKYYQYVDARKELMINLLKVMADNRLDAIVTKTVEHQPTLIKDGINPPYVNQKGIPTLNTFLIYVPAMTVPSGFTVDNLPTGITFIGRPYTESTLIKLAYSYEQATHHRVPPKIAPALHD